MIKRNRFKFLQSEDEKLIELIDKYGVHSWPEVAKEMPGRNVRQCRERWKHYLSNDKKKNPWTEEEEILLIEKVNEIGHKWTKLAKLFPERTDIQLKLKWNMMKKNNTEIICKYEKKPKVHEKKEDNKDNQIEKTDKKEVDVLTPDWLFDCNDIFDSQSGDSEIFCFYF